jgi:hypothetical protein
VFTLRVGKKESEKLLFQALALWCSLTIYSIFNFPVKDLCKLLEWFWWEQCYCITRFQLYLFCVHIIQLQLLTVTLMTTLVGLSVTRNWEFSRKTIRSWLNIWTLTISYSLSWCQRNVSLNVKWTTWEAWRKYLTEARNFWSCWHVEVLVNSGNSLIVSKKLNCIWYLCSQKKQVQQLIMKNTAIKIITVIRTIVKHKFSS